MTFSKSIPKRRFLMSLIQLADAATHLPTVSQYARKYLRSGKLRGVVYFCVAKVRRNDMTFSKSIPQTTLARLLLRSKSQEE
jgi:hypothetical protein